MKFGISKTYMRGVTLLITAFVFLFSQTAYALQILTQSEKGIEVNTKEPVKVTLKNEQSFSIMVKVDVDNACKDRIKVFPRMFELSSLSSQTVKILAKEKPSGGCKVLFTWEEKKEASDKANTVNTRFVMSLPLR